MFLISAEKFSLYLCTHHKGKSLNKFCEEVVLLRWFLTMLGVEKDFTFLQFEVEILKNILSMQFSH